MEFLIAGNSVKVVHLDHTWSRGGAEFALVRVLEHQKYWVPSVVVPRRERPDPAFDWRAYSGYKVVEFGRGGTGGNHQSSGRVISIFRLGREIVNSSLELVFEGEVRNADVLHANTSRAAVFGVLASKMLRKPLVVHLRDHVSPEALGPAGYFAFTKWALRCASGVVANSRSTLASAEPFLNQGTHSFVIPSPVGMERRRDVGSSIRDEVRSVGMVARIAEWKGHELAMRAFAQTFANTSVRLKIAGAVEFGEDAYMSHLLDLAKSLAIQDQIDFLGYVSSPADLIDDFDICLHTSTRLEPLGQNVLQYLARARPLIASGEGGPTEWVQDGVNGLLFAPRSVTSLAEKLSMLRQSLGLRRKLAVGASNTELPTVECVAKAHYDAYLKILGRDG